MEGLIRQAFLHVDLLGPHVLEGHFDLIGPDGEIILPQVWETMIKPDFSIEMQMWPIPELEKGKQKHPHGIPGMPPGMAGMHGMHGMPPGGPPGAMPAIEDILKGLPGGPGGKSGKRDKKHDKKGAHGKIMMPPPPPLGSVIPPPPGALPLHGPPGGFPHGMPPPPMDPIGGPGGVMPGLGDLSLGGYDDLERKKSRKKKGEVPALMRWAGGQRRKK